VGGSGGGVGAGVGFKATLSGDINPRFIISPQDLAEIKYIQNNPELNEYYCRMQKCFNEAFLFATIVSQGGVSIEEQSRIVNSLKNISSALSDIPFASLILNQVKYGASEISKAKTKGQQGNRAIVHRVVFILLSLWRFKQYSEGRWVSSGDSCRSLVAGMLTGLPSLIAEVIEDEAESNFHINGFTRLQEEMKQFVVIVAFASYPSDTALRLLLGNGRFLKIAGDLKASLDEEVGYLAGLRAFTWSSLGDVCGLPGLSGPI